MIILFFLIGTTAGVYVESLTKIRQQTCLATFISINIHIGDLSVATVNCVNVQ